MKRVFIVLLVGIVLATGWILSRSKAPSKAVQANSPAPLVAVHVISPERKTVQRTVEVYGSLAPKTSTDLKSELIGPVQRIFVKEWDRVKPGDLLLEVDPTDFKLELSRTESGIKMAKSQLMEAQVGLNRARRELTRAERLKEGGLITGQEKDERRTSMEAAEARVALTQAQVAQAEAQAATARHTLQKTTVAAPIEGIVSQRRVDVGDFLDKGTPLFTLVDNRILDFKANAGRAAIGGIDGNVPGNYWDAGLYLSVPLFDGLKTKGQVMQAQSRLATTEYEMKRLLDQIALQAREAINRVDEAIQIIKGLEASFTQVERLLTMAETGYRAGVKTKLEVDDAETDVLTAKVNLARARRDYLNAWTLLTWIMGEDLQTATRTAAWKGCPLP